MPAIEHDVHEYEAWLRTQCEVVEADLKKKHKRMRKDAFSFLRATYFRWARTVETLCPELSNAPHVLAVGDIHVENYGTWRDAEARLVWGINDFDEAARMPYVFDLVRLGTSARLSPGALGDARTIARTILRGYREGLANPGAHLVLEGAVRLSPLLQHKPAAVAKFWYDLDALDAGDTPAAVSRLLRQSLPAGSAGITIAPRVRGGGSLGRPRFVAVADWNSGRIVREAKAVATSAWHWAHQSISGKTDLLDLAFGRYRAPDPGLHVKGGFLVRRLAPDAQKIDVSDLQHERVTAGLLRSMGKELAAVHRVSITERIAAGDLDRRGGSWLADAICTMEAAARKDYARYRAVEKSR